MKADFTRDSFNKAKHFSRVLMQQGRVTLDADHNEQIDILLHYLRTLARDLIGPYGAPDKDAGFQIQITPNAEKPDLTISKGHFYVDGILVENEAKDYTYLRQPHFSPLLAKDSLAEAIHTPEKQGVYFVYLDVWEQHITPTEDDDIREKALNGPDTCSRAKIVWQVRTRDAHLQALSDLTDVKGKYLSLLSELDRKKKPTLQAKLKDLDKKNDDACVTPPESKYRGLENHLYRVEIHDGGTAGQGKSEGATFKWSRDNGSVTTAWLPLENGSLTQDLRVAHARGFAAKNWVELSNDISEWQGDPGTFVQLINVEGDILSVGDNIEQPDWSTHPKVRRWDQSKNERTHLIKGVVPVVEVPEKWFDLEDGLQIAFSQGGEYRTGDYWLIPARVATGKIEWSDGPQEPKGIVHHYAPLCFVEWTGQKFISNPVLCVDPWSSLTSL